MINLSSLVSLRKHLYPSIISILVLIISLSNYKIGFWVTGWDNLHPEFDLSIYWERILQSVWQDHQGLGAVATQAHASEIPRAILLTILSVFLPASFLRWFVAFLLLWLGPLGVYYLTLYLFKNEQSKQKFAFLAAIYYIFNLGTLQHYFVFLEMFLVMYGFIGWLFLYLLKCLKDYNAKNLIIFALLNIAAAPMAHTPTLWFVYLLFVGIFMLGLFISEVFEKKFPIKKYIIVFSSILLVNMYWFLPTIYFALTHADDVSNAKITRLFSEEAIMNNRDYSSLWNIAILKGFLFNWQVLRDQGFSPIFEPWLMYYTNFNGVILIGYGLFGIFVAGVLGLFLRSRFRSSFAFFVAIPLISMFFLKMDTPPFGQIFVFLQGHMPFFKEAIRFPFTKFSIPLMFGYSLFIGYGSYLIYKLSERLIKNFVIPNSLTAALAPRFIVFVIFVTNILFCLPMLNGWLISDTEKAKFPEYYKQAFEYLNRQPNSRIATYPAHFLFGWLYFDWKKDGIENADYQGAGFSWFYSRNPILEREFDRWFPYNEDFYNEYQYAIYSEDLDLLEFVLNKYDVSYIFYDDSVSSPYSQNSLFKENFNSLLLNSKFITLDKTFDRVQIYKVNKADTQAYINIPEQIKLLNSNYKFANVDNDFYTKEKSAYFATNDSVDSYPFMDDEVLAQSIADNNLVIDNLLKVEKQKLTLSADFLSELPIKFFIQDNILKYELLVPEIKDNNGQTVFKVAQPSSDVFAVPSSTSSSFFIDGSIVNSNKTLYRAFGSNFIDIYNFDESLGVVTTFDSVLASSEANDCFGGQGGYGKNLGIYPNSIELSAKDKNTCIYLNQPVHVTNPSLAKISFEYKTTAGARAVYCISLLTDDNCLNQKYNLSPAKSVNLNEYSDYVLLPVGSYRINLIAETDDKDRAQSVVFKDIKIALNTVGDPYKFNFSNLKQNFNFQQELLASQFPLKVVLPDYGDLNTTLLPNNLQFNNFAKNCDFQNNGPYQRTLKQDSRGNFFEYSAVDSISCDSSYFKNINSKSFYNLEFDAKNIAGKPLDICVYSIDLQKCLLQDRLSDTRQNFVYPSYPYAKNIILNIANQSIGISETKNNLYSVEFNYIPYIFLKNIHLGDSAQLTNAISLINAEKLSKYKYIFDIKPNVIDSNANNRSVMILNQAYENGWVLYDRSTCKLGLYAPFMCKKANAKHVVANNWANGWEFTEIESGLSDKYLVIFWPQYLQFLGYIIFVTFVIVVVVFYRNQKPAQIPQSNIP